MSVNMIIASQLGNNDDIRNFHDVNADLLGNVGDILLPLKVSNVVFRVTNSVM